jgi:diazepam-binding inhibitor (GABA receptor modulating acyl-CoA-binding protein)
MSLEADLLAAAARVRTLPHASDDTLLRLYGLYKQATLGDNGSEEPGMFDFVGRAKWEAWSERRGMTKEAASQAYIALVDELFAKPA